MWRESLKGYLKTKFKYFNLFIVSFIPFLFILFSCSSMQSLYNRLSGEQYISDDYRAVLKKWTRKGSLYKGLKTELLLSSVYKGDEFRKAYTNEYCRVYSLPPHQAKNMLRNEMQAANDYDDFLVVIDAGEKQWDDFSERNSLWNVFLLRYGHLREKPFEIRKLKENKIFYESFFPFISPWSSVYSFRFKRPDSPGNAELLELVLTGLPGTIRLAWSQ